MAEAEAEAEAEVTTGSPHARGWASAPARNGPSPTGSPSATYEASGATDCGGASYWFYSTFDLTGDQIPDLVMTHNECGDAEIGESYWKVFPGVCE